MKIPLIWLKDYMDIKKPSAEIAKSFTALGLMLDKPITNDVLDVEHRFDRSDWLSIIGCARDLAAMGGLKLKYPKSHTGKGKPVTKETLVDIKIECPELVYRFNTRVFKNIKVKESPQWLKERLEAYGMPSINNIVDVTNFVMVEYGNPMHAQDLAKFAKREIVIRHAKDAEKITTLDGTEIILDNEAFILTQNNEPIVIGGIVGGIKTGVTSETTEIIVDAGNYDQANIRKTARKIKVQNESVLRYDKFLHPHGTQVAIERATQLILELAGGEYYENIDYYPNPKPQKLMAITLARLQKVGGMEFSIDRVKEILEAIDYTVIEETENSLKLEIPYFRTDIEVEDDIVSDILRLSNYENIPLQLIEAAPPKEITSEIYKYEEKLKDALVNLGLHEFITDPITSRDGKDNNQIEILNSQNPEKNALRSSIYKTLYPVLENYEKYRIGEIGLFEIGKIYLKTQNSAKNIDDYKEIRQVEVIYYNEKNSVYENNKIIKQILFGLFLVMEIDNIFLINDKNKKTAQIYQGSLHLGELRHDSFVLNTKEMLGAKKVNKRVVNDLQIKPTEDISLILGTKISFGEIYKDIKNFDEHITGTMILEEYLDPKNKDKKSVLVQVEFGNSESTQTIKEALIKYLEEKYKVMVKK